MLNHKLLKSMNASTEQRFINRNVHTTKLTAGKLLQGLIFYETRGWRSEELAIHFVILALLNIALAQKTSNIDQLVQYRARVVLWFTLWHQYDSDFYKKPYQWRAGMREYKWQLEQQKEGLARVIQGHLQYRFFGLAERRKSDKTNYCSNTLNCQILNLTSPLIVKIS